MDGVIASFVKKLSESREKEMASQETIHALQLVISEAEEQNISLKGKVANPNLTSPHSTQSYENFITLYPLT